ncbi:MAG: sulfatase-like hydrolase/transferase, partial [Planctomycetota bacterium]
LLVGLAIVGGAAGVPKRVSHVAALGLLASTVVRAAEVICRLGFGKKFEIEDFGHMWGLFHAWANTAEVWHRWLYGALLVLSVALIYWLTARAFRCVSQTARSTATAGAWLVVLQALVLFGLVHPNQPFAASPLRLLSAELVRTVQYLFDPDAAMRRIRKHVEEGRERMASAPGHLEGLRGADVHLLVLESYGRLAFRHPALAADMRRTLAGLESELRTDGLSVCTSACAPAVKGGRSGLAHAELLTGTRVPNQRTRDLLMTTDLVALPKRFQAAGYRTHELMPAMPIHWPEGYAFYGIDEATIQSDLSYNGFKYGFGHMPDQYALLHLLDHVIKPAKKPLFSMFVGVSSHAPWASIPPYIADWRIDADAYREAPARARDIQYRTMFRHPEVMPAYGEALAYVLRASVDFARRLTRPSIVVVLGDHQAPIAGAVVPPDLSFDVPVHVLSNRPELLEPLREMGFHDGLDLPDATVAWPMAEFGPRLLRAYSR